MNNIKLNWIDTLGGPHLLIPAESLSSWNGDEGWFDHLFHEDDSDYARACRIQTWIGVVETGGNQALVLSGDAGAISWIPNSDSVGGLLVQWIGADNDKQILDAIENGAVLSCLSDVNAERLNYTVKGSGLMHLIDSVDDGNSLCWPYLDIEMPAGEYLIEAGYYEDSNLMLVLRRLTKA